MQVIRVAREEAGYWRRLLTDRPINRSLAAPPIEGRYLITTDRGVFLYQAASLQQISRVPAFGIAIAQDNAIYLATWNGRHTTIVRGHLDELLDHRYRSWQEIWQLQIGGFNARVHQISAEGDSLWLANTAHNCLTRLDRHNGSWKATIAPFLCPYGQPIQTDHNHINGVLATPSYLVFSAFKIGREGAFGVVGNGRIRIFRYHNMGVHDCAFDGKDFLFCDSYSFWDEGNTGLLLRNNLPVAKEIFARMDARFVRGVAGTDAEIVVGNSFTGDHNERFSGHGAIAVLRGDGSSDFCDIPAAQVYDIVRTDGQRFSAPPAYSSAEDVVEHFRKIFGDPIEDLVLLEALSGERVKTFDERDRGEVAQYMASSIDRSALST